MLLKELEKNYPLVYAEAIEEAKAQKKDKLIPLVATVSGLFVWYNSKLGETFWTYINNSDVENAEKIYPQLFVKSSTFFDCHGIKLGHWYKSRVTSTCFKVKSIEHDSRLIYFSHWFELNKTERGKALHPIVSNLPITKFDASMPVDMTVYQHLVYENELHLLTNNI